MMMVGNESVGALSRMENDRDTPTSKTQAYCIPVECVRFMITTGTLVATMRLPSHFGEFCCLPSEATTITSNQHIASIYCV